MSAHATIAAYMVAEPITVSPKADIAHTVRILLDEKISGAPVVDDAGELVGFISKKDCFRAALNATYYKQWGGRVERYMARNVETLDSELDLASAAERFIETPYRLFPVTRQGQLVGVLSRSDLLRAFFETIAPDR